MMYVDPSSQFKYVAKSTPNVPSSEATSTNTATENTTVSTNENIAPSVAQVPPNAATHFQAPEHIQKQAALAQNAGNTTVPISPGQIVPPAGQMAQAAGVPGVPGLTYDGKRMRKTMQRRTVDYNSSVIRFLETRKWFKCSRNQHALQPQEVYNLDVVPPCGYIKNPMNAVTTKFVRTSTNKLRCPIFCVVWTPEGRRLVTGASSGEFTLWNGLTFNFETILQAHDRAVRSMVWSHNDLWLLTGDHGGFVKYWQSNMNNVKMYEAHKEPVRGLSFSPSDNKFASCSDDGLVKVWDFYRCAEERELKGHGADVKCVDWHPTKGLLVSGSKDSQQPVKLWDPKSGNSITTLHCHKSTVMAAKWNSNGNWLVTGSRDHLLKLFDIRMMKELQTFRGHKKEATVVAWHPVHETLFASGGSDGSLMFWLTGVDEKAGGMEKAHEGIVWSLSWHPLGHILCSGSNDHTSKFWARNRPGDAMTDKYNLDIQGSQEDGEYGEEGQNQTSVPALAAYDASQVIPGVGLPVTARNVVLPDSRDVDTHLYGESSKDNPKAALIKPSATMSSEFPYPPAFKQTTSLGNCPGGFSQSIPGLDMSNTSGQMNQEQDGYKIPHPPRLRLPAHPQSNQANQLPQGNHAGNPLPVAGYPSNRPPFVPGQRHSFDYRGPPGPRGQDPNKGPTSQFQQNQYMRFPGPHVPGGPRGNFIPQGGPGGPHNEPWRAPHHRGPHGAPYRTPDVQLGGARPQNTPDQYGYRGNFPEGLRPRLGPMNSNRGPRQLDASQLVPGDSIQGGLRPRGPLTDSNVRSDVRPPLTKPPGQHGPMDSMQGDSGLHRPPNDHNMHLGGLFDQDGLQDESHRGPAGHHIPSRSAPQTENVPSVLHGPGDAPPPGPNLRPDSSQHGGPRPLLNVPSSPRGSTEHGPGGINVPPDSPHAGPRPLFSQYGPRDGSQGPPTAAANVHSTGSHRGPRPSLNMPSGPHGLPRGPRAGPPSPRDGPNFGPRTVTGNSQSFGSRAPRPPQFEQPRLDHSKPELKSPEAEKRGASEPRENVLRKSRDSSPRDSPPVSSSNHAKQERRTSDPGAPGILGDYVTHMQEMHRGMLENIASSAVGRLFGQPDIARTDRPPHGRTDTDRAHGSDTTRTNSRTGDRGDRPPHDLSGHRPPRDRSGDNVRDRERPEIGRREDPPHDRLAKSRQRDRPSFEGRPGDRPSRGNSQDSHDGGQPAQFDSQESGRQSDESDLPAHEKPGLLPIPDVFLPRGPLVHEGPPRDPGSGVNHRPPDRRRDHNRFQDGRNDMRSDNPGFARGPRDRNPMEMGQSNARLGGGLVAGETNAVKPLMSLLDASPVGLGSPPGQGGMENRGRKRSMEHEFERPPKRMGAGDNRERPR